MFLRLKYTLLIKEVPCIMQLDLPGLLVKIPFPCSWQKKIHFPGHYLAGSGLVLVMQKSHQ
jgi:hypothetical protein